ncbi:MAG: penicillin-binding protein 1C [Bacteroidales bacterium]|nr:penicillin-binding protein 1C [Bacteroidales bacterium]MCF8391441.1 penicillin-binding protein 1C [Bacteroidales bacterium]
MVIPKPDFNNPHSTVVLSSDGRLLGAHIAKDGQWRFPPEDALPDKYKIAAVNFEDRYFYYHPGVNLVSLFRSLFLNIKHRKIVSGGSTITMQVARMSGNNPPRTLARKIYEIAISLKMELLYSKEKILNIYASNAPFGGNVVGIEAASWRYFGRNANELSWSEAALLAVLPNAPSLIYPGKNDPMLMKKRNYLLEILYERKHIDSTTLKLSKAEALPDVLFSMPVMSPQLLSKFLNTSEGGKFHTTIDYNLQENLMTTGTRHMQINAQNEIHNLAAIVADIKTGRILAYVGNLNSNVSEHAGDVDMITAERSTGSILKPLLYASMLESGELLPDMLVRDVPVEFSGYSPKNFDMKYNGAVPASQALSRSLNVPAVEMLRNFGPDRFLLMLNELGFKSFDKTAEHYGLSLILGGGETSLLELVSCYARMAAILRNYPQEIQTYNELSYLNSEAKVADKNRKFPLSAGSIWYTFKALRDVNRPFERQGWENFTSSSQIAWKTGTSFGFRDAWAIGFNSDYVVGVWAGNADGEGRTGLTGVSSAAPFLFDIFDFLNTDAWFVEPYSEMEEIDICVESGHRASLRCTHVKKMLIPKSGLVSEICPYHKTFHLTSDSLFRVNASCYKPGEMSHVSWFILPPAQEYYYKKQHSFYLSLPPLMPGCEEDSDYQYIELLYPGNTEGIYIPVEHDGMKGKIIFEASHRNRNETLFWHLDNKFVGETRIIHQIGLTPSPGIHLMTIVDSKGNSFRRNINIIEKVK